MTTMTADNAVDHATGKRVRLTLGERIGTLTMPHSFRLLGSINNFETYRATTADGRTGEAYRDFPPRPWRFVED